MNYDVICVGGGLGGASLAHALVRDGLRVLVLERESTFKDRVRGEGLLPWGVNEAKQLGVYDTLAACGVVVRYWTSHGWKKRPPRDLAATTPNGACCLDFYHPEMQEAMLGAAEAVGADVRRGVTVREVRPGAPPSVTVEHDGRSETLTARLVVGADAAPASASRPVSR